MATDTAIQTTNPQTIEVTHSKGRRTSWTYRPNVDIFDTPEELLLMADIPGANAETIDVSMESGVLTIQAEVAQRHHGAAHCTTHEYGVGGYHRRFEIDSTIDTEAVQASYRDGALTVRLPKGQQSRRRRIPVSA
jgi:HSP20 family molecular chaperone IbpA